MHNYKSCKVLWDTVTLYITKEKKKDRYKNYISISKISH